jgi:hypothetical protein
MASTKAHSWPSPTCSIIKGTVSKEGFDLHLHCIHSWPSPTCTILKGTVSVEELNLHLHGLHHGALVALTHLKPFNFVF